jgi:phosphoglycerol transferase MdoB-like AlkP superfamily enzyme
MHSMQKRNLLATAIVIGTFLLCLVVSIPRPESAIGRLTPLNLLLNFLPVAYFLLAFWLIFRRMLSSAVLTAIVCLAITLGSNFKFTVTSQPLVASDFLVFVQVLENPVLFEKYFREQWYFLPLLVIMLASAVALIRLERPVVSDKRWATVFVAFGVVLLMQIQTVMLKPQAPLHYIYTSLSPEFDHRDPMTSVQQLGLFTTLINSARGSYFTPPAFSAADRELVREISNVVASPQPAVEPLPNLVVVQNEAFFDFRVIDTAFPGTAYAVWDRLKKQSQHGLLYVDTYGGATLRTEFSVLTGIPLAMFGAALDYPYLNAVSRPLDSVPWHLKSLNYETIAVHPFSKTFWRRHVAYPRLGFDSFLSIDDFGDGANDGPYVSDRAVCQKILELLGKDDQPRFVFAVTMENHGPWSFDRQQTGNLVEFEFDDFDLDEEIELQLMRYLYHARNAASMAECLIAGQASLGRPSVLLFYGDHAPAMPAVFTAMEVEDPWREPAMRSVPFLLWNGDNTSSQEMHITVSALPSMLLKAAQLPQDDYLRMTDYLRQQCGRAESTENPANCPASASDALQALTRQRLQPLDR